MHTLFWLNVMIWQLLKPELVVVACVATLAIQTLFLFGVPYLPHIICLGNNVQAMQIWFYGPIEYRSKMTQITTLCPQFTFQNHMMKVCWKIHFVNVYRIYFCNQVANTAFGLYKRMISASIVILIYSRLSKTKNINSKRVWVPYSTLPQRNVNYVLNNPICWFPCNISSVYVYNTCHIFNQIFY